MARIWPPRLSASLPPLPLFSLFLLLHSVCFFFLFSFFFSPSYSLEQRGQLLSPDKRLAFGAAAMEGSDRKRASEQRGGIERKERGGGGGWRLGGGVSVGRGTLARSKKSQSGLRSVAFLLLWGGCSHCRSREKMRSNHDLDSKTPRHNREGLTPHEPPHPAPLLTSVKTITERRVAPGERGPRFGGGGGGLTAPSPLTPSSCCQHLAQKPLEIPGKRT